jgi:hypothetical protein
VLQLAEWLQSTRFSATIQTVDWIIPLLQSIHILMIGVVFVSILVVALRVLGRMRADEPFVEVWQRFAPWFWTAIVAVGVATAAVFGRSLRTAAAAAAPGFSTGTKSVALATVVLWLAIIFLGRAIAYDVEIWESLSFASGG